MDHLQHRNTSPCLQSPDSLGSGEAPASPPSPHRTPAQMGFNSDLTTDSQTEQYSSLSCDRRVGSHDLSHDELRHYDSALAGDGVSGCAGKHKRRRRRGGSGGDSTTRDQATNTDLSSNGELYVCSHYERHIFG